VTQFFNTFITPTYYIPSKKIIYTNNFHES